MDSIPSTKMTNSASSKYIDIFYLYDKLFIQDPIIIMKCEYGCDRILLKKYYGLHLILMVPLSTRDVEDSWFW